MVNPQKECMFSIKLFEEALDRRYITKLFDVSKAPIKGSDGNHLTAFAVFRAYIVNRMMRQRSNITGDMEQVLPVRLMIMGKDNVNGVLQQFLQSIQELPAHKSFRNGYTFREPDFQIHFPPEKIYKPEYLQALEGLETKITTRIDKMRTEYQNGQRAEHFKQFIAESIQDLLTFRNIMPLSASAWGDVGRGEGRIKRLYELHNRNPSLTAPIKKELNEISLKLIDSKALVNQRFDPLLRVVGEYENNPTDNKLNEVLESLEGCFDELPGLPPLHTYVENNQIPIQYVRNIIEDHYNMILEQHVLSMASSFPNFKKHYDSPRYRNWLENNVVIAANP